jgi:hypothetical protein
VAPLADWGSCYFIGQARAAKLALGGYARVYQNCVGGLLVGFDTPALRHVSGNSCNDLTSSREKRVLQVGQHLRNGFDPNRAAWRSFLFYYYNFLLFFFFIHFILISKNCTKNFLMFQIQ